MKAKEQKDSNLDPELRIYTIREVSQILKITEYTARKYITQGKIKAFKQGWKIYVKESSIKEYLAGLQNMED